MRSPPRKGQALLTTTTGQDKISKNFKSGFYFFKKTGGERDASAEIPESRHPCAYLPFCILCLWE